MPCSRRPNLGEFRLVAGGAPRRGMDVCLMQAVAWWDGQTRHTDHPKGVSPMLNRFGISLNDVLSDRERQRLIPFIPRLAGSARDADTEALRARMLYTGRSDPAQPGSHGGSCLSDLTRDDDREGGSDPGGGVMTASAVPDAWNSWVRHLIEKRPTPINGSLAFLMPERLLDDLRSWPDRGGLVDLLLDRFDRALALGEDVPTACPF